MVGKQASCLPLLLDPSEAPQGGVVGVGIVGRCADLSQNLPDHGGLPDLPGSGNHLNETARLSQPVDQVGYLGTGIGIRARIRLE